MEYDTHFLQKIGSHFAFKLIFTFNDIDCGFQAGAGRGPAHQPNNRLQGVE